MNLKKCGENEPFDEYGISPFTFRIYREDDNLTKLFNCKYYCHEEENAISCLSTNLNITNPETSMMCSKICENSENYVLYKKEYCLALKSSPRNFNNMFIIIITIGILSLIDAVLLLSPKFSWSPSYIFLFRITADQNKELGNPGTDGIKIVELLEDDTIEKRANILVKATISYAYPKLRNAMLLMCYCCYYTMLVYSAIGDYRSGNISLCVTSICCICLPSIPAAFQRLERQIRYLKYNKQENKAKDFLKLFFITILYIAGGWILIDMYETCTCIIYKVVKDERRENHKENIEMVELVLLLASLSLLIVSTITKK